MRLFRQKRLRRLFLRHLSRLDATSWASRDFCFGPRAVTRWGPSAQCQFPLRTCKLPVHRGRITMGILAWLVLGLIAGFIGSKIVNKSGEGLILDRTRNRGRDRRWIHLYVLRTLRSHRAQSVQHARGGSRRDRGVVDLPRGRPQDLSPPARRAHACAHAKMSETLGRS